MGLVAYRTKADGTVCYSYDDAGSFISKGEADKGERVSMRYPAYKTVPRSDQPIFKSSSYVYEAAIEDSQGCGAITVRNGALHDGEEIVANKKRRFWHFQPSQQDTCTLEVVRAYRIKPATLPDGSRDCSNLRESGPLHERLLRGVV